MAERETKPPFRTKRFRIDVAELKTFRRLKHFRPIREMQVSRLKKAMLASNEIPGVISLNETGRDGELNYVLIDGTHRLEAAKRLIEEDPTRVFFFTAQIYDHLSHRDTIRAFIEINGGAHVTPLDIFIARQEEFPIYAMLQKAFPAPVVATSSGVKVGFRVLPLLRLYLIRNQNGFATSKYAGENRLWELLAALNHEDYEALVGFAQTFIDAFGMPGSHNDFSSWTALSGLMKIYFKNITTGTLSREEIADRWAEKVLNDEPCHKAARLSGFTACPHFVGLVILAMNHGHSRRPALSPVLTPVEETDGRGNGEGVASA